jgi:hypothetical protein
MASDRLRSQIPFDIRPGVYGESADDLFMPGSDKLRNRISTWADPRALDLTPGLTDGALRPGQGGPVAASRPPSGNLAGLRKDGNHRGERRGRGEKDREGDREGEGRQVSKGWARRTAARIRYRGFGIARCGSHGGGEHFKNDRAGWAHVQLRGGAAIG